MKNSLVTISIPTYNSANFLGLCLQAVKNQSYKHIEINIVDGGSSDTTTEIAKKFGVKDIIVSKGSLMKARFEGAKKSRGLYVLILDSDQIISKDTIKKCIDEVNKKNDMVILEEDVYSKKTFLEKLFHLDRKLVHTAKDFDPYTSVILPRFFKRSLLLKAYNNVPKYVIKKASLQDHAILYLETWKLTKNIGYVKNAVRHMEPSTFKELWRKFYRWGYLSISVDSTVYDVFFKKRTMRFRKGMFQRKLMKESFGSILLLLMKNVPYVCGILSGIAHRIVRRYP